MLKNVWIYLLFVLSGVAGFSLSLYTHSDQFQVPIKRGYHTPTIFVSRLANNQYAGKQIFQQFCSVCHGSNSSLHLNAPAINDRAKWKALKKLGMKNLLTLTTQGHGAMPARGGCFECSDAQIRIDY